MRLKKKKTFIKNKTKQTHKKNSHPDERAIDR